MLKANSYDNLFGSPAPMERSRPRERRFTRQDSLQIEGVDECQPRDLLAETTVSCGKKKLSTWSIHQE